MNDVNNDGDSSDSENENEDQTQSSDDELSFESDDEGNFQQNFNKKRLASIESGSEDDEDEELEDEDEEIDDEDQELDEEASENELEANEKDDSEELSFEDDSDDEHEPRKGGSNQKSSSVKENGTAKQSLKSNSANAKSVKNQKAVGSLLRVKQSEPNTVEAFENELNKSGGTSAKNGTELDEYEKHDTDDEEDIRNTVGNIPMHWYDEYKHIGYDWDAKKIIKPTKRDQLDDFLKRMEDPNFWRTVKDPQTGQDVVLSEADIDLIKRINSQRIPDTNFDDYTVCIKRTLIFCSLFKNNKLTCFFSFLNCSPGLIGLHRR